MKVLVIVGLFFTFLKFSRNQCCQHQTIEGLIDLSPLKGMFYSIKPFIDQHHTATLTMCGNLDETHQCAIGQECHTPGPTPIKDVYKDKICYYIGDLGNCTFGQYDHAKKTSKIFLPGKWSDESPRELRSMEIVVHCDHSITEPAFVTADCTHTQEHPHVTLYTCHMHTIFGCPGYVPPVAENFFTIVIGVGGILLIIIAFAFAIYFIVGAVVFLIRKIIAKETPWTEIVLGYQLWRFGVLLVVDGALFMFEGIFTLFGVNSTPKQKREYSKIED